MISVYFVFLSILIIVFIGTLSGVFSKKNRGLNSIFICMFLKSYVRQNKKQKIFFVYCLKYPLFLSAALIMLQVQLLDLAIPKEKNLLIMSLSMALYVIMKALYTSNVGNRDETYFSFVSTLDDFFFDLLLMVIVFSLRENIHDYIRMGGIALFAANIFLKVSNLIRAKYKENQYKNQEGFILDQAVFALGEYIYILSLFFFSINSALATSFTFNNEFFWLIYHLKLFFCIIFIAGSISGMEWILMWLIRKKTLDRQMLRVKNILAPLFFLVLIAQIWRFNGS